MTKQITDAVVNSPTAKLAGGASITGLMLWMCLTVQAIQGDVRDLLVQLAKTDGEIAAHSERIDRLESRLDRHEAEADAKAGEWRRAMETWRAEEPGRE